MFSKIGATVSNKYHVQLQKSICCREKSEGASIGILLKKTCNFIRKRLQYCEVYKNTRSSHQRCSIIKGVLINFAKFTGKHLCQSLFLNKVAKETLAPVFSCEFCEIYKNTFFYGTHLVAASRTPILKIICERLLLKISISVKNCPKEGNF